MRTDALPKGFRKELALAQGRRGRLTLTIYDRAGSQVVTLCPDRRWLVGRDRSAELQLDERGVSALHALVQVSAERGPWIEDLGSTNGTFVNGERVTNHDLLPGDRLGIGAAQGVVASLAAAERALLGHEQFLQRLSEELARATDHRRPLSVAMLQSKPGPRGHVAYWADAALQALETYQLAACYASNCVELLLPDLEPRPAERLLTAICQSSAQTLHSTLVSLPAGGSTADALIHTLRRQLSSDAPRAQPPPARFLPAARWLPATVRQLVERLARARTTVLVIGETGTGKEQLARELHRLSQWADQPFIPINCATIPEQLAESTFFGHRAGAFTGAEQAQPGVFESAGAGTLFLDGVDGLSPRIQGVLLEVLETGLFRPVGAAEPRKSRARVVASSPLGLDELVAAGRLRQDLRHRLGVSPIELPPLRGRRELIAELANHFALLSAHENDVPPARLSAEVVAALCGHHWPGNMRELRNVVERGTLIAQDETIQLADLPKSLRRDAEEAELRGTAPDFKQQIARYERSLMLEALRAAGWNQSAAARQLGMPRRTLVRKLKTLDLERLAQEKAP